jgi:hypothetical protein
MNPIAAHIQEIATESGIDLDEVNARSCELVVVVEGYRFETAYVEAAIWRPWEAWCKVGERWYSGRGWHSEEAVQNCLSRIFSDKNA